MNYRNLAGLSVSEIGFGGWGIGGEDWGPTDDMTSMKAIEMAWSVGINFYDTAPSYGRSEMLLGRFFREAERRENVIICTKTVDFNIGQSLRHFGYIDVLLTHHRHVINDEIVKIMEGFVKEGSVRRWGMSAPAPVDALNAIAADAKVIEVNLSMMDRRALEMGLLDNDAVGFIARTPLNFGFLSGLVTKETVFPEGHHLAKWPREQIEKWDAEAKECLGDTQPGADSVRKALGWVLAHPVSTVVVGMMTPQEVMDNT